MAMPFEFATAARILFGEGKVREAPAAAAAMGRRALVVTGAPPELRGAAGGRPGSRRGRLPAVGGGRRADHRDGPPRERIRARGALRPGDRHGRRQRHRCRQGAGRHAGQPRRPARLPGGDRPRPAARARFGAVHRHPHHRGHGFGSHAQRRAGFAPAPRQSQSARQFHAAQAGGGGSRIDARPAARASPHPPAWMP